ncbi:D-2-hydroxyacid dehydrogenase [Phyllobacterium chamaecytisi]|uniref:D-2-hydroxyacid dehydrogenase n=1 Tax=Phyllobacterium chamaecytisi TaxID=2876082 RepID=UPI001CD01185|nr:D-2-hydroxyacid dehydrogenase [Phyllobacterium sp. KW56]MBZ9603077.1 D-2-hydroxyacid dehydrogenase [Phyllobacterium sp. KW56]
MAVESAVLTIVINDPAAEDYARLLGERFPQVRAIAAPDPERLERHIADADVLLGFRFPVDVFDQAKKLRWFQCSGAGVDALLPIRDRADHITVTNARGLHGDIITDFVMAGVTMLHWDFPQFLRDQAERKWNARDVAPLADRTLGIVGLGSIGTTIARRAKSAGMTVIGSKRDISVPVDGVDRLFAFDALDDLLPLCDFVVLALPATAETVGLIGATEIARMRRDAFLINIARGNVVVEADLIKALQAGAIAGALLDVFEREPLPQDSPLWGMSNVILTPHAAGNATNYRQWLFSLFVENIERFLNGQALKNLVDLRRGY